ncbi:MAG: lipase family protein [Pseudorhodoplanes sp.]|nr:hypothetical protein [Pseudorhodoplanes sp.]MBW7947990.1 lipase family protein [Pseudorhodoplanes sp.]MCL4712080.1 lipase family protein [Pseudorhodoplanes sp.]GIK81673.1 MAG: hypothetical protein BroJett024_27780 [Alphaproteobacteria bacterium]
MSFLVEIPENAYVADAFDAFAPTAGFSLGTARAMMWVSQLAYEARHARGKIAPVLARWSMTPAAILANDGRGPLSLASTRGIVARGRGATVIAFAGTDPVALPNWVTNFNLGPRPRLVHRGFEMAVAAVWRDLADALRTAAQDGDAIILTGHSLGGALAIVAADRAVRELKIMPTAVYAFGSPRVAGPEFALAYRAHGLEEQTFRLVHGLDMIAAMPPSRLGFRHVGHLVWCARGQCFSRVEQRHGGPCDEPQFIPTLARGYRQRARDILAGERLPSSRRGLLGWYQTFVLPPTIVDHLPERYRRACEGPPALRPQPDRPSA